jgi:hypothetical protein
LVYFYCTTVNWNHVFPWTSSITTLYAFVFSIYVNDYMIVDSRINSYILCSTVIQFCIVMNTLRPCIFLFRCFLNKVLIGALFRLSTLIRNISRWSCLRLRFLYRLLLLFAIYSWKLCSRNQYFSLIFINWLFFITHGISIV